MRPGCQTEPNTSPSIELKYGDSLGYNVVSHMLLQWRSSIPLDLLVMREIQGRIEILGLTKPPIVLKYSTFAGSFDQSSTNRGTQKMRLLPQDVNTGRCPNKGGRLLHLFVATDPA